MIYIGRGINFKTTIPINAVIRCPKKIFFGCANGLSGYPYNKTIDDPNDAIKNKPKGVLQVRYVKAPIVIVEKSPAKIDFNK